MTADRYQVQVAPRDVGDVRFRWALLRSAACRPTSLGFSLVELLLVITIIGILIAWI